MNTLTPLEYFAAHAPAPAEWFEPEYTLEKKPPQPEGVDWCDDCRADCGECRTPEACTQMREWQAKRRAIDRRNETAWKRAWMAQWPWVWAKMVLKAHPDTKSPDLLSACRVLLVLGREPTDPGERADYERASKIALSVLEPEDRA